MGYLGHFPLIINFFVKNSIYLKFEQQIILDQLYLQNFKGGKEEAGAKIMYGKNVVALYRLAGMNGNIVSIQIITDFIW